MKATLKASAALAAAILVCSTSLAGVTNEEAAALKTRLTPLGAERAGNREGTIPAWEGGMKQVSGDRRGAIPDLFAEDKPLFIITAQNMAQHAERLSDGVKALLQKYPGYRVVVYPTRRTAAAPQWVYDNTLRNATRASMGPAGSMGPFPVKAFGGIPFPIPKSGEEAIWNHILRWNGEAYVLNNEQARVTPEGKAVLVQKSEATIAYPYYRQGWDWEKWEAAGSEYVLKRIDTQGPPIRAGEMLVVRARVDDSRTLAYAYLTGQRRVRRLPIVCCDVPNAISAGITNIDEVETFTGSIGRYDWKLVGKREMYIPYNVNKFAQAKSVMEVAAPGHINPELMRFELHRVWVVDATLKAGERHSAPKARFYLDEDTWLAVTGDRWDAQGNLWKVSFAPPMALPSLPGTVNSLFHVYDMVRGGYFIATYAGGKPLSFPDKFPQDNMFTPEAISGEGVR
jgi:hypothetical protein